MATDVSWLRHFRVGPGNFVSNNVFCCRTVLFFQRGLQWCIYTQPRLLTHMYRVLEKLCHYLFVIDSHNEKKTTKTNKTSYCGIRDITRIDIKESKLHISQFNCHYIVFAAVGKFQNDCCCYLVTGHNIVHPCENWSVVKLNLIQTRKSSYICFVRL